MKKRVLTDFDLYLINEGTHYKNYEKLGAHVMEIDGIRGVHFAVWAPNAKSVSVVGDFNNWDGKRHQMKLLGESGIWEIFIPGLDEGELYKFEIKSKYRGYKEQKADPFAFYFEVRPKSAAIVYNIENKHKWQDVEWMEMRKKKNWFELPIAIYEVHLGSWMRVADDGNRFLTYREFADKLIPYVKELGFTHIELLPISEHPLDASWGYQTIGYFAPTSRFGRPEDFMYFVDKCHQNGIGVIIDWVPAHFPKDAHGLGRFDGTCLYEHEDPRKGEHRDWGTLIFNYGRNEVRNYLISNALFWLEKYHIDGLRVDAVASMLYLDYSREPGDWIPNIYGGNENLEAIDFLKKFNEVVHQYHPGVLTIAEESTAWTGVSRPTYLGGLGFSMKWNMGWMHDTLEYFSKDPIFRKYHSNNLTFSMLYAFTENFVLPFSHDEVVHGKRSMLDKMPGDMWQKFANLRTLYGYMYGHPGKKLLFMGSEFGQWREWNFDDSLDWHLLEYEPHRKLQRFLSDLNNIYKKEPAMYEVDFEWHGFEWIDFHDSEQSIISFIRRAKKHDDFLVFVFNLTPVPRFGYRIGVPKGGYYREIMNSDSEIYWGGNLGNMGGVYADDIPHHERQFSLNLTLPPLSVLIFKPE
ncbi:1,4-alpha-glucan branching enzyme GlgB [Dissulfurispira thermophila]|uniref:1,4-alpha-glucan branching enzyme GlgB n=2 Tax=root TaxID=1 RepID=A0A7G1H392_9BACT|nr:1,4-alpha-glucan branching protein GlgB [Dissulfurispira thermophila]BCB96649.1 1,4-alpha-glucan branching enzyme GlgB [Dissulfurispira thermophila]